MAERQTLISNIINIPAVVTVHLTLLFVCGFVCDVGMHFVVCVSCAVCMYAVCVQVFVFICGIRAFCLSLCYEYIIKNILCVCFGYMYLDPCQYWYELLDVCRIGVFVRRCMYVWCMSYLFIFLICLHL